MARTQKKEVANTSITDSAAAAHIKTAKDRGTLFCDYLPGFHLIKLAKGGAWRYRYKDSKGKARTVTVGKFPLHTPNTAAEKVRAWVIRDADPMQEMEEASRQQISEAETAKRRTLKHYLNGAYAVRMESWGAAYAKMTAGRLEKHFGHLFDSDMSELSKADLDAWAIDARKELTHTTLTRVFGALKAMLNAAVDDGVLEQNPLSKYKLPSPPQTEVERLSLDPGKEKRRALTDAEQEAIIKGLDLLCDQIRAERKSSREHGKPHLVDYEQMQYPHWFVPFCLLALHTGLAPSDLYSLTWDQLNVQFGMIRKARHKTIHLLRKPNGKPAQLTIKLNADIQEVMRVWQKEHLKVIGIDDGKGLVFPPKRHASKRDRKSHLAHWEKVKGLGGVTDDLDFYGLRHNFISRLVMAGVPLLMVAQLVGHKSATMIERHYAHLCPMRAEQAMNIVGDAIAAASRRGAA